MVSVSRSGPNWWNTELRIPVDMPIDAFMDLLRPNEGVGDVVLELEDGSITMGAQQNHSIAYRSDPWDDIERDDA